MDKLCGAKMEPIITIIEKLSPVLIALIASIPGIIALLVQRKNEREKLKVESEEKTQKSKQDKATNDAAVAKQIQDIYQEIIEDIKKQSEECKSEIVKLSVKVKEINAQNIELIEVNSNLRNEIAELTQKVKELQIQLDKYEKER
jgi:chromosome segregation ATPase